jgi:hypothetical protein
MADLAAAAQFVAGNARLLERRRFASLAGDGPAEAVVRALAAYRNDDGGLGCLEPDVRAPSSQPPCVLYALQVLDEIGARDSDLAAGALDWLETITNDDGGVPFVLPSARGWPHAPWFRPEDDPPSSLLITAGVAAGALRLGLVHPWLERASEYCWERMDEARAAVAYTVRSAFAFLDAAPDRVRAEAELDRLAERVPPDGVLEVGVGAEGEVVRPLELAPRPEHAARRLFADDVIERELDGLAAAQQEDGGWTFTWGAWNPAAELEWRGIVTVEALAVLRAYGRL